MSFRQQLESCLRGRVCFVGLGNSDYGDDGSGVCLAEKLLGAGVSDVYVAGSNPERFLGRITQAGFDTVVFLDAAELGAPAGSAALLGSAEMKARYPQVSTHKISLATLAKLVEANAATKAWLLGVQPERVNPGAQLTPCVQKTLDLLTDLLLCTEKESELAGTGADRR